MNLPDIIEATEQRLVAAMLKGAATARRVFSRLSLEELADPRHQQIGRACLALGLETDYEPFDVARWLTEHHDPGLADYCLSIMEHATEMWRLNDDIDRQLEYATRRRLGAMLRTTLDQLGDLTVTADSLLATIQQGLTQVTLGLADNGLEDPITADDFRAWLHRPDAAGASTGLPKMNDRLRMRRGDMVVFTGRPGSGKTTVVTAVLSHLAAEGWRWLVWNAEHSSFDFARKVIEPRIGRHLHVDNQPTLEGDGLDEAVFGWFNEQFRLLRAQESHRLDGILMLAANIHTVWPFDGLLIDPWTELDLSRDSYKNETERHGEMLRQLRSFAKTRDVCVTVIAHPSKAAAPDKPPSLRDIAGTAHFDNRADVGVSVMRDGNDMTVAVVKARDDDVARCGTVEMSWSPVTRRFTAHTPV